MKTLLQLSLEMKTLSNKTKITGGNWKGRSIDIIDKSNVKPTKSYIRENLFNWIGHNLSNKWIVDAFAGSGSLGFEAALPNLLPEDWRTDVSLFIDTANLWGVDYDKSIGDSDKIRSSTGASASVFTPIGPLSLTLAHPITKAASDQTESFTFRLGTSF